MRTVVLVLLATALAAAGCGDNLPGRISIVADDRFAPAIAELAALTPWPIAVGAHASDGFRIDVVEDAAIPAEGFALAPDGPDGVLVRASDVLGAQYGAAAALEALGFRFRHPYEARAPERLVLGPIDEAVHQPEIRVRGFQLHTLHPIGAYFAFWEPSETSRIAAHRIIDWVVKNRGNYLQWVALDDILDPVRHAAWRAYTRELIDYAHLRGVRVGLNIQLFGQSNLQNAFDLSDDMTGTIPIADEIAQRLPLVVDGVTFDVYDLSFGEFFNADPPTFVAAVDEVRAQLRALAPDAEMHAVVHVGADQIVSYQGEDLIYYFLVKFADPSIVPDIHTVMFYTLFDPAGGAYHHDDFADHRAYLVERACAGEPAAYFPETAYWVAFDNSVPMYLPIYVHNRWRDLAELRATTCPGGGAPVLDNHLLFSTGWEWGYWLNDVTALRASYELPATSQALIDEAFAPDLGAAAADLVGRLAAAQREHLMLGELIAYVAGRDVAIDAGRALGIVSQPDRLTFDDLAAGAGRATFRADVLAPLAVYAAEVEALAAELERLDLPVSRWSAELRDGFAIDRIRARFAIAIHEAVLAQLDGDAATATARLAASRALLADGRRVVTRRHRDLHDPHGRQLVDKTSNQTFYQYGYLHHADILCYWERELAQAERLITDERPAIPHCLY